MEIILSTAGQQRQQIEDELQTLRAQIAEKAQQAGAEAGELGKKISTLENECWCKRKTIQRSRC